MVFNFRRIAVFGGLIISGCVAATEPSQQVAVTSDFERGAVDWSNISNAGIEYVWNAIVVDGKIEICGAYKYVGSELRSQSKTIMNSTKVIVNNRVILPGLSHFKEAGRKEDLSTATANCKATGVPVPDGPTQIWLEYDGRNSFRM